MASGIPRLRALPLSHGRRIAVVTAIGVAILVGVAVLGARNVARLERNATELSRIADVKVRLERLLSLVKDAETGGRGYVITGEEQYLEPLRSAESAIPAEIAALRRLVVNRDQRARLDIVASLISRNLQLIYERVDARRDRGFDAARRLVATGEVKAKTDSIRAQFVAITEAEDRIYAHRERRVAAAVETAQTTTLLGVLVAFALGIPALYALHVAERERHRAARERAQFFEFPLDMMCVAEPNGYFRDVNAAWEPTLGYSLEEVRSRPFMDFVHPEDRAKTAAEFEKLLKGGKTPLFQNRYRHADGSYRNLLWSAVLDSEANLVYAMARDITAFLEARAEVRRLSGMLPICAWCKNIRNDEGYWERIEVYVRERSQADFSHGICPECHATHFVDNAANGETG